MSISPYFICQCQIPNVPSDNYFFWRCERQKHLGIIPFYFFSFPIFMKAFFTLHNIKKGILFSSTCTILKAILYYLYSNYIMTLNVSLNIICWFGGWMETSKCTQPTCIPLCINVISKYATDCKRMHRCVKKKKIQ